METVRVSGHPKQTLLTPSVGSRRANRSLVRRSHRLGKTVRIAVEAAGSSSRPTSSIRIVSNIVFPSTSSCLIRSSRQRLERFAAVGDRVFVNVLPLAAASDRRTFERKLQRFLSAPSDRSTRLRPPMIDRNFGTIDFFVVFDVTKMNQKCRKLFS